MFQKYIYHIVIFFFAIVAFSACDDDLRCIETVDNNMIVGFYKVVNKTVSDTTLNDVSVWGKSSPDTLIYNSADKIKKLRLPLDSSTDSSEFELQFGSYSGSLRVVYEQEMKQISIECGFYSEYTITRGLYSDLPVDSVVIVNPIVTSTNEENIRIYFTRHSPSDSGNTSGIVPVSSVD